MPTVLEFRYGILSIAINPYPASPVSPAVKFKIPKFIENLSQKLLTLTAAVEFKENKQVAREAFGPPQSAPISLAPMRL